MAKKASVSHNTELTLGPVLFNWKPEAWRDFYYRIADEAPVGTVYIGEVICSKRAPFFEPHYRSVAQRLTQAGKAVVFSTLSEVMLKLDRRSVESVCCLRDVIVEANDSSALWHLADRPHHIGPFLNVYNEDTLTFLAGKGATNFCLPPELPAAAIDSLGKAAERLGVTLEIQVFGRVPLALSARCYHARAHGRVRDNCRFVCIDDPDGLELKTLDGRAFLAINGIQTLSYDYLNLIDELPELGTMGVKRFRLSPHTCDMVQVAEVFRNALDKHISAGEAEAMLDEMDFAPRFSNGFFHGQPGHTWNREDAASSGKTLSESDRIFARQ